MDYLCDSQLQQFTLSGDVMDRLIVARIAGESYPYTVKIVSDYNSGSIPTCQQNNTNNSYETGFKLIPYPA